MYVQVGIVLWLHVKTFSPRLINVILFSLNIRGYHNLCSNWHVFSFCVSKLLKPHKLFSISWYWFQENDKRSNIQDNHFVSLTLRRIPSFWTILQRTIYSVFVDQKINRNFYINTENSIFIICFLNID